MNDFVFMITFWGVYISFSILFYPQTISFINQQKKIVEETRNIAIANCYSNEDTIDVCLNHIEENKNGK